MSLKICTLVDIDGWNQLLSVKIELKTNWLIFGYLNNNF